MKSGFFEYYRYTDDELKALWDNCIFVFDTNVLLNAYRIPPASRKEFANILEKIQERVWLPHQVALEFHNRRIDVLKAVRANFENMAQTAEVASGKFISGIREAVSNANFEKWSVDVVEATKLHEEIHAGVKELVDKVNAAAKAALCHVPSLEGSDDVLGAITDIFDGRVGKAPGSQADLDKLFKEGEQRYAAKIPPGFGDAGKVDKEKNPLTFTWSDLVYENRFGDFLAWKQLLDHCSSNKLKNIVFVTNDLKEDWWFREAGKTIGPHPMLRREIQDKGKVERFWMYTLSSFLARFEEFYAGEKLGDVIADVRAFEEHDKEMIGSEEWIDGSLQLFSDDWSSQLIQPPLGYHTNNSRRFDGDNAQYESMDAVGKWLIGMGGELSFDDGYCDFVWERGERRGFKIVNLNLKNRTLRLRIKNELRRLREGLVKGQFNFATLVLVLDEDQTINNHSYLNESSLMEFMSPVIHRHLIDKKSASIEIIWGVLTPLGDFKFHNVLQSDN